MGPFSNSLRKHHRGAEHLRTCTDCRAVVERERRYLERLRSAEIPAASTDFTARLLERTHVLAAAPEPVSARNGFAIRAVAVSASGALAAAGVITASAFLLAGDPLPQAERPTSASAVSPLSLASGGITADIGSGTTAGGRAEDSAPSASSPPAAAGELTTADLAALRETGWACPELASMGFRLESAKAVTRQGTPAVELRLSRGGHGVTVVEQHVGAGSSGTTAPINVQTGRPASEDGFVASAELLAGSTATQGGGSAVWVRPSEPVAVIYRSRNATISYFADAGPGTRPGPDHTEALQELVRTGLAADQGISAGDPEGPDKAGASEGLPNESLTDRLGRGFRVMLGLPAQ